MAYHNLCDKARRLGITERYTRLPELTEGQHAQDYAHYREKGHVRYNFDNDDIDTAMV